MGTVSRLAQGAYIAHSNNYQKGRNGYEICKFTPHIMAGILTGKQCSVNIFQNPNRQASANYCIGNDGDIICNVYEEDRAYTSSSKLNDNQAITVEVSNCEVGGEWKISEAAWNSLVELAVDVCKRYGFRLVYDGTPNGNLTTHDMFANTNCPGQYLKSRLPELAEIVNTKLQGEKIKANKDVVEGNKNAQEGKITQIQATLNKRYNYNISVDNIYGNETHRYLVKALQHELNVQYNKGLVEDGIFGNLTKQACINVKIGAIGNITFILQAMLICKGYDIIADGIFGSNTENTVKEFQKANGLVVDGICGKCTWGKLFE